MLIRLRSLAQCVKTAAHFISIFRKETPFAFGLLEKCLKEEEKVLQILRPASVAWSDISRIFMSLLMSYKAAKLRYLRKQFEAIGTSAAELSEHLPDDVEIRPMSGEIDQAWHEQWFPVNARIPPNGGWDWPSLRQHYAQDPENLCVAMWAQKERLLCGLMIATLNQTAVKIEYIESSPSGNHPLRNRVLLLGIDVAIRYADGTGRDQLWIIEPASLLVSV